MFDPIEACPAFNRQQGKRYGSCQPMPSVTRGQVVAGLWIGCLACAFGLAGAGQRNPTDGTAFAFAKVADAGPSPAATSLVRKPPSACPACSSAERSRQPLQVEAGLQTLGASGHREGATGSHFARSPCLVSFLQEAGPAELVEWAAPQAVGQGMMHQFAPLGSTPETVLIHFHGAVPTVKQAFARCELDAVLVILNFPGLSSAYERPFADNPKLFERILSQSRTATTERQLTSEAEKDRDAAWQRVYLSSFSAGYGAVRQILKQPEQFDRIEGIVAADSIYAGLKQEAPARQVDDGDMRGFLRFASEASNNRKTFVLSHSAQQTPYASTTETADYLLNSLQMRRSPDGSHSTAKLTQTTRAQRGRLTVLGYEGTSGSDHMQHLYQIDKLWEKLLDIDS